MAQILTDDPARAKRTIPGVAGRVFASWSEWLVRGRPDSTSGLADFEAALNGADCPVCGRTEDIDQRWNDHFLYEGYQSPEAMARLRRGAGFCARHMRELKKSGLAGTIAFVHLDILKDVQRALAARLLGGNPAAALIPEPGYCIVCDYDRDVERRECFFLALLLKGRGLECYGRPALVCVPHLSSLVEQLDPGLLNGVIATHLRASAELRATMGGPGDCAGKAANAAIRLILGPPPRRRAPIFEGGDAGIRVESDPIKRFRRRLGEAPVCPVCAEVAEASVQWIAWLDVAAANGEDIADVVPLCPHHVWQALQRSGAPLALPVANTVVEEAHRSLLFASRALMALRDRHQWIPEPFRRAVHHREARRHTVAALRGGRECPLCRRARQARDRAIELLGALLDEKDGRDAFERGYELCVPHAARALELLRERSAMRVIVATVHGRLSVLRWELEEQLRRYSWSARPEGHGNEAEAGLHASLRFSGAVCENGP